MVRLNPNIPWKTRGNGAVCVELKRNRVFSRDEQNKKNNLNDENLDLREVLTRAEKVITEQAVLDDATTNPGIVVTDDNGLPIQLYWSAVRGVLEIDYVQDKLVKHNALFKKFKTGRGIIGAASAISWASNLTKVSNVNENPSTIKITDNQHSLDFTYELITYREPSRWGTSRELDLNAVKLLDTKFPSTFNNYDYKNNHSAITPNSPCPVLFGIRGDDPEELKAAFRFISSNSEPIHKYLMFITNQGTDDHLVISSFNEILPDTSVIFTGRVCTKPITSRGGHVFFELTDSDEPTWYDDPLRNSVTCAANEPTKEFRNLVRKLVPGDDVRVFGGVRTTPLTINIEKLEILELAENKIKLENPSCKKCGKKMKSIGWQKGFRCRVCHEKINYNELTFAYPDRMLELGFYEVPVSARRHLSKPLKRFRF